MLVRAVFCTLFFCSFVVYADPCEKCGVDLGPDCAGLCSACFWAQGQDDGAEFNGIPAMRSFFFSGGSVLHENQNAPVLNKSTTLEMRKAREKKVAAEVDKLVKNIRSSSLSAEEQEDILGPFSHLDDSPNDSVSSEVFAY